ncbi:MAG: ABC transporter ATP-binding protein [Candidatus Hydrogenedentes bacterium]|nr:ABC transporter ATP-binding protein [Candidatus Hydrogenedentota bacterium]
MSAVIEVEQLTKIYEAGLFSGQDVHALEALDLAVEHGEIFGYLGPNGSGKTTTIKMLLGLIFPTSGTMKILGRQDIDSSDIKEKIGYLPEGAYYPDFLRGDEILRFYGKLYRMGGKTLERRIDEVVEIVGMGHARKRLMKGYSKGMRQRIGLAQALLSNPDILILDEPTTGLDPLARKEIRDILAGLRDQGKTLLISSHELAEVELISDRVGILYQGVLQTIGTLDELLKDRSTTIEIESLGSDKLKALTDAGIEAEDRTDEGTLLKVPATMTVYDAMVLCKAQGAQVVSMAPKRETLEELFVRIVGFAEERERSGMPEPVE